MFIENELISRAWTGWRIASILISFCQIMIGMLLWTATTVPTVSLYMTIGGWFLPTLLTSVEFFVLARYSIVDDIGKKIFFWLRLVIVLLTSIGVIGAQFVYFLSSSISYALLIVMACWGIMMGAITYELFASTCCLDAPQDEDEDEEFLKSQDSA